MDGTEFFSAKEEALVNRHAHHGAPLVPVGSAEESGGVATPEL